MVGTPRGTAAIALAPPAAAEAHADEITTTSARLTGAGTPGGSSATAFFEYGPTVGYGSTTTAAPALGSGSDPVGLSATVTGLSPGTTYHYRLVVQSGGGIAVTPDAMLTTVVPAPSASTGSATLLSSSSTRLAGSVNPNGGATSYWFEYGTTTAYGQETSPSTLGAGAASVAVQAEVTGLSPATTYHYRLVAQNSGGTSFGLDRQVTMPNPVPLASTGQAAFVTSSEALLQGSVNPNGEATSYWFEYGTTTAYGQVTTVASAGAGFTEVFVEASLTGLAPSTTYHFRLLAESAGGTAVGADREFSTRMPPAMGEIAAPALRFGRLVDGAVPLALSWSATSGSTEICTYEVGSGSGASPLGQIGVVETTAFSTSSPAARGLYYSVEAVGCDGAVSAPAESAPVDLRLLQESTTALRRGPGWTRVAASDGSGGHVLTTTTRDARLTLSFTGRSLALVAPKGPRYGVVLVSLDGGAATRIDLYRASRAPQRAVYVVNFPSAGNHKAVIRSRPADSRRRVDIDAFAVVG